MDNLYRQIIEMYERNVDWNYYGVNMERPFDKEKAREFILKYFEHGAKKKVILPYIDKINKMRYVHTVSSFFIGLLIKEKLCPQLTILSKFPEEYKFSYLWFLLCLFHDMGYAIEQDWTYKFEYRKDTCEYMKKYKKRGNFINESYQYDDLGLIFVAPSMYKGYNYRRVFLKNNPEGIVFNNGIVLDHAIYSRRTVLNYFEYCKMADGIRHYDHGIVGGLWLYDSLLRNYYQYYYKEKEKNKNVDCKEFTIEGNWHFSQEQWNIFAYLADCIIAHNIWPANENNRHDYIRSGLSELVFFKNQKNKEITFEKNPLLFILTIADTIDPIKLYLDDSELSEVEIWSGVDVKFDKQGINIRLIDDRLSFQKMSEKIAGLKGWVGVTVNSNNECREIDIKY